MKPTTLTALAFATTAMLSNTSALANVYNPDVQTNMYNGSYCQAQVGADTPHFRNWYYGITNTSNLTRYISCPVLLTDGFIDRGAKVHIRWTASASGNGLTCSFNSVNPDGNIYSKAGSRKDTGWITPLIIPPAQGESTYAIICALPPGGTLNAIQVDEFIR